MDFTATGLSLGFLIQTNGRNRLRQWKAVVGCSSLVAGQRHTATPLENAEPSPLTAKGSKFAKRKSLDAKPLTKYNNLAISPNDQGQQGQQPTTAFLLPLT